MYETAADFREARNRRIAYIFFAVSMAVSTVICAIILFLVLAPKEGKRFVGQDATFAVGAVVEVPVTRLELTQLLPNSPTWSEDVIFVVKQRDNSYQAFLALDPQTGCKLNWRIDAFVDDCSQTRYTISGRNATAVTTLSSSPVHMIELPTRVEPDGKVYILDRILRRDRQ